MFLNIPCFSNLFSGYGVVTIGFSRPKGRLIDLVKNLSSRSLNTKSLSKKKRTEKCQEKKVNANKQTLLSLSFSFLKSVALKMMILENSKMLCCSANLQHCNYRHHNWCNSEVLQYYTRIQIHSKSKNLYMKQKLL